MNYAELQVTSNFSFLRGGSHPAELVEEAVAQGYTAIAITDRNTFSGIVRAHMQVKKIKTLTGQDIQFIPACRLDIVDGPGLLAYPTDQAAYSRLSNLLSKGNLRTEKGQCELYKADVYEYKTGIIFIVVPPEQLNADFEFDKTFIKDLAEYRRHFGSDLYIAASCTYNGDDHKRLYRIAQTRIPMAAVGNIYYHAKERRDLQDILTCIREKCNIHNAGFKLHFNAERYIKPIDEIHRLFKHYPEAIENTLKIAEACKFTLDSLRYIEPEEAVINGLTPQQRLTNHTWEGAHKRYPAGIPQKIADQIKEELDFIERRKLAPYFLRVYKYTQKAEDLKILHQGRGSAANSTVCYCLGITSVDPMKARLLFSRFMSDARDEWPDIDVDFEHERREEIIQYVYEDYGRDKAAIVATVTQERHRGAIRDVGKAMGLSDDIIKRIGATIWDFTTEGFDEQRLRDQGLDLRDPVIKTVLILTEQLIGFPRQLGQHTGGFVITAGKVSDLCPVLNARMKDRTQLEWNKDDLEDLRILKVDVLGLGMLTMIRKAFDLVEAHYGKKLTLANIPQDDPKVYDMICHADTIGVFQIESRAQMSMLPRLKPREFYDLVIEVAIVRPGPIQGDMVHPYLRRRSGLEPIDYPSEEIRKVLERTKGVPLFQEQAMEIAMVAGGFTATEADQLRRSMATFKAKGEVKAFKDKLTNGMVNKGYDREYAARIFKQLEGFGSYGFPESHAASFALLVYVSSWLKYYYPDVFCAALLNSQPMGFYQPAQIVRDARDHGIEVRPVDVNLSFWDNTLEATDGDHFAVRLGFRQAKGLSETEMQLLINKRVKPYLHVDAIRSVGISEAALEKLSDADAFNSLGADRRKALWEIAALADRPTGIFKDELSETVKEGQIQLPLMTDGEHVLQDYKTLGLSLKKHPVALVREKLFLLHNTKICDLKNKKDGDHVRVSGLITVRQRPGSAKGVLFMTLEDETGAANIVVWQKLFDRYRKEIIQSRLFMTEGKLQIEGEVIHVVAHRCFNLNNLLHGLSQTQMEELPVLTLARGDETTAPVPYDQRQKAAAESDPQKVFFKGRNFQ